jgi:hypothetical protein
MITALSERCQEEPSFRQDLIDFDVISPILKRMQTIEAKHVPALVGTSRDMKSILRDAGHIYRLVEQLDQAVRSSGSIDPELSSAIITVTTSCNDNRIVLLRKPDLLNAIVSRLSNSPDFDLLKILNAIILDDDRESKVPAPVFARESLVEGSNKDIIIQALRVHTAEDEWDRTSVFNLVRELSMSQDLSKQFALDEGFLRSALQSMCMDGSTDKRAIAKYLRQLAFADEMKPEVLQALKGNPEVMNVWTEGARNDRKLSSDLFGTLANLCIRSPENTREITCEFQKIISLCHHVLNRADASDHELVQCLQLLRCMTKFEEGLELLHCQFTDEIAQLRTNRSDKTLTRIAEEIKSKLPSH